MRIGDIDALPDTPADDGAAKNVANDVSATAQTNMDWRTLRLRVFAIVTSPRSKVFNSNFPTPAFLTSDYEAVAT
jgi:hypothetical protein